TAADGPKPPAILSDPDGKPVIDWNALLMMPPLSAAEIADKIYQPVELVEKKLRDYRNQHLGGYVENTDRRKGEPKYRYKMDEVLSVVKKWVEKRLKKLSTDAG